MSNKKYKLEDLKVGMFINSWHELEDIYGVYIYLDGYDSNIIKGKILYICEEPDNIVDKIEKEYGGLCVFYQSKDYIEEDIDIYE